MRALTVFHLLLAALTVPLIAQQPVGSELIVNQTRAGRQMTPDVGVAADGSFVVVWRDEAAGKVWARRYGADGKPRGGEIRVSRLGNGQQTAAAVAVRQDGSFVVVWNRVPSSGKPVEVYASRFAPDGQQVGQPILAGYASRRRANEPAAITMLPDGGFFVAFSREDGLQYWQDEYQPSRDLYGRRFTRDGSVVGGRVTLNPDPYGDQSDAECGVSRGSELVCTWRSDFGEGWFGEIMVRRFDLDGLPLGPELQVNEEESRFVSQIYPTLAIREDGTVLVAWLESFFQIRARMLDASGQFLAPSFALVTTEQAWPPPEAAAANDGFIVLSTDRTNLLLRRVSTTGQVVDGARIVNRQRDGYPWEPAAALGPAGGAVAWTHLTQGAHEADILVRPLR